MTTKNNGFVLLVWTLLFIGEEKHAGNSCTQPRKPSLWLDHPTRVFFWKKWLSGIGPCRRLYNRSIETKLIIEKKMECVLETDCEIEYIPVLVNLLICRVVVVYPANELLLKSSSSFKFKLPSWHGMPPLYYYCPTSRNAIHCSFPTCAGIDTWILFPDKFKYQSERQILKFLWYWSESW